MSVLPKLRPGDNLREQMGEYMALTFPQNVASGIYKAVLTE